MHLDQKVSLKAFNTFGMEVEARYFVEAKTHSEVLTLLNYRHMIHMPILFLGGGSNVLLTRNFAGIVIRINSKGIATKELDAGHVLVTAEAGENWDDFVGYCVNNGWAGLENLSLIPGTVGAAPIQNIGAYGVEVQDVIDAVQIVEIDSGKQKRLSNADCEFGYRDSVFKRALKGKVIVLNVTFRLTKVDGLQGHKVTELQRSRDGKKSFLQLDYGDIRGELQQLGVTEPTVKDVREAVCNIRRRKLPDPAVVGNAGSFFKNPLIGQAAMIALQKSFPDIPVYPQGNVKNTGSSKNAHPDGNDFAGQSSADAFVKIPAAWLIEQCGWKGYRAGDAGVHPNQPLVLVNYGNATGTQILELAGEITESVFKKFGIQLEIEVNVIG